MLFSLGIEAMAAQDGPTPDPHANALDGRTGYFDAVGDCCFLAPVRFLGFLVPSVLLKNVLV